MSQNNNEEMAPKPIAEKEWIEIYHVPQIQEAWGVDEDTTPEEFSSHCYGARFNFVSGGPGYVGDLYIIYGDSLSGAPFVLIRNTETRLEVVEEDK